jgi:hypothetical protein
MERAHKLLSAKYNSSWTTLKPFVYDNNTITFTGDAYFDPVLVILKMRSYGILEARTEYVGDEIDRVIITNVNIEVLEKVMSMDPEWNNLDKIMSKLGYERPKKQRISEDGHVIISNTIVSGKAWNAYWEARGKIGPDSGWEIPSAEDIKREVGFI